MLSCLTYYSGVLFGDDDRKTQRVQRIEPLKFAIFTLKMFHRTVRHCVTTRYHGGSIKQASEGRGTLVSLNKRIWTLLGEYRSMLVQSCFDVDPIRGLLALAQMYEASFHVESCLEWLPKSFVDSFVSRMSSYDGVNGGALLLMRKYVSALGTSMPRKEWD